MDYGITISKENVGNSIVGCVTTCDHPNCHELVTKYYIRGEDPEFSEMYKKTRYAQDSRNASLYEERVIIIGFCDEHKNLCS